MFLQDMMLIKFLALFAEEIIVLSSVDHDFKVKMMHNAKSKFKDEINRKTKRVKKNKRKKKSEKKSDKEIKVLNRKSAEFFKYLFRRCFNVENMRKSY